MRWFADLKLFPKLILSFALVLAMTSLLGVFAERRMSQVNDVSTDISRNWLPSIQKISQLNIYLGDLRTAELEHILAQSPDNKARFQKAMDETIGHFAKLAPEYEQLIVLPEERSTWEATKADMAAYLTEHAAFIRLSSANQNEQALERAHGKAAELHERVSGGLDRLVEFNRQGGEKASDAGDAGFAAARWAILGAVLLTVLLGMGVAWLVSGMISRPVVEAVRVLQAVAQGDLTQTARREQGDEIGDMQQALGEMMHNLSSMVQQVRAGADSVATASTQIAQGNTDLSGRTEEQASSLEQTAASIEEMSGTVRTNADNANQANQLASAASSVAVQGGEVVGQVTETMNDIQSSSRKISDIIGVIDGIAFQTNILALNAAVEAARAGEQGRGFAVVAGEVRSLAQRSAQAAREIKVLINDSVEKVNAGSALVTTAGSTMSNVVAQVRKVTDLVGEIAHASTEQSQGIGQINQAVTQLDQMTQQNAALVEQSMAAADSLKAQAQRLSEAVGVFRTRQVDDTVAQAQSQAHQAIQQARQHSAQTRPASPSRPAQTPSGHKAVAAVSADRLPAALPASSTVKALTLDKPVATGSSPSAPAAVPRLPAARPAVAAAPSNDDWETF
ncbi:MAG: methyl-accepting chemotaxis protein [Rubrivivax sp.]|nr:MAG: methyl-accepting chemotaxis protein [Rubrivivax sp.]